MSGHISKKRRFEVFKRDKFTCQYCGGKSPDVELECDHVQARSDGGSDEIDNLITSCMSCNKGKGGESLGERVTGAEAARRLGITAQAIGMWARRDGAPVEMVKGKPLYVWPQFPRWREAALAKQVRDESTPKDMVNLELREQAARTRRAELELGAIEGEYVRTAVYSKRLGGICELLRAKVQSIPGKFSPRTIGLSSPAESQAIWEDCARELLTALSETESPDVDDAAA